MTIQDKLKKFAFGTGYNYIIEQQKFKDNFDKICFLLVGSVATGLCSIDSDVDICMLCERETFEKISVDTKWQMGCPTEIIIDGIQLHYYAISTESVIDKINKFDDITFYVYGTATVIGGNSMIFDKITKLINSTDIKTSRFNIAINMLNRRTKALNQVLILEDADTILYIKISLSKK